MGLIVPRVSAHTSTKKGPKLKERRTEADYWQDVDI